VEEWVFADAELYCMSCGGTIYIDRIGCGAVIVVYAVINFAKLDKNLKVVCNY